MKLNENIDPVDGSSCTLLYEEENQWLRAVWQGYVDNAEATQGATDYFRATETLNCPFLLNDNSRIEGPWFDSVEWLERVWAPRAARMGLRYVAHVTTLDLPSSINTVELRRPFAGQFEVQIFSNVPDAEAWLRACQKRMSE